MIHVEFSTAIAGFLSFVIVLVFTGWIFYTNPKKENSDEVEYLQQCPYCTYVFFAFKREDVLVCPRCKSFLQLAATAPAPPDP